MLSKINVFPIVVEHVKTLRNFKTKRWSVGDGVVFFGAPVAITAWLMQRGASVSTEGINILLTSLSIFVGLLFSLLVLAHSMRGDGERARKWQDRRMLREINANLEYAIVVSLFAICVLLTTVFAPDDALVGSPDAKKAVPLVAGATFFLASNFFLTLFMVLKRMHVLMWTEYRDMDEQAEAAKRAPAPTPKAPATRGTPVRTSLVTEPAR